MYSVVGNDGQVYGPVDTLTLCDWAKQGRLTAQTNLIDAIQGRVLRADALQELNEVFFVAPPIVDTAAQVPPIVSAATVKSAPATPFAPDNYAPIATSPPPGYVPVPTQGPIQQAASFQQGVPGSPSVQVNNYIALNQQTAVVVASPRNKTTAILLCIFLGGLGIHRYYLGRSGTATAMLLMSVGSVGLLSAITLVWSVVDLIMLCTGSLTDNENRLLA